MCTERNMAPNMSSMNFLFSPALLLIVIVGLIISPCGAWICGGHQTMRRSLKKASSQSQRTSSQALSSEYLENDLVAIRIPPKDDDKDVIIRPRFCVVRPDGGVHPLCYHEDDVETDLFIDPRISSQAWTDNVCDSDVAGTYGEGWYGQRPVPSLGGGPGYGAEADPVWSVDEGILEKIQEQGVDLPVLDVGIAHGEKARGGAF